ncbi:MAG: hypothetical protein JNK87_21430 [Bryobacterales bacterium]|nr:hypothetical protein [Bryobacterales bacterium]
MKPLISVFLALLLCAPAFGQLGTRLYADIPFPFELTGITLPAGNYTVRLLPHPMIQNDEPRLGAAFFLSNPWSLERKDEGVRLVFNKYGDRHFLSQVYTTANYYQLPKSKQERELVTSRVVAGLRGPEVVVVMLRVVR